ncbi:MAG: hypothetical protein P4L10_15125 [Acidobacteriaceae bacterium]|jgi:hypothetical protein|nr:hypothetical protein [Acidobacteriaceae bacterium]
MNLNDIVAQIDAEIARLTQAKQALLGIPTSKGPGRPRNAAAPAAAKPKKRKMSAAGRARIAAAQKARWAKVKAKKSPAK